MVTNEFKEYAESAIIHTYNRFPVVFDMATAFISMIPMEKNIWILRRVLPSMPLATMWKNIKRH